jgi:hypothetical protein
MLEDSGAEVLVVGPGVAQQAATLEGHTRGSRAVNDVLPVAFLRSWWSGSRTAGPRGSRSARGRACSPQPTTSCWLRLGASRGRAAAPPCRCACRGVGGPPDGDAARPVPGVPGCHGCRQRSPAGRRASSTARRGGFSVSQHGKVSVTCARPPPLPVMRQQPRRLRRRHPHLGCAAQAAAPPLRPQRVARDRGSTACGCLDPESLWALGRAPDGGPTPPARPGAPRTAFAQSPSPPAPGEL